MKISGFTFVRNADKLYYPIQASIESILPMVDEFIIALGNNDKDDKTLEIIKKINSRKIKIYHRTWSEQAFVNGKIFADETNFALSKCTGDWCFYLQCDEVVHEKDLKTIQTHCKHFLNNKKVEGFLFKYYHFYGDYNHYLPIHGWYKNEIRIIRNHANITSIKDAQSFRTKNNQKLKIIPLNAHIYHYGWVRPPTLMQSKNKEQNKIYHSKEKHYKQLESKVFEYGPLKKIPTFKKTHPQSMHETIKQFNWEDKLDYNNSKIPKRKKFKHEKRKYRILTFLEKTFNNNKDFFGYSNWELLKEEKI